MLVRTISDPCEVVASKVVSPYLSTSWDVSKLVVAVGDSSSLGKFVLP